MPNEALDWRVGFDCGHAFDLMPELMGSVEWDDMVRAAAGSEFEVSYKDIAFARGQCKRLCEQAALAAEAQA